MRLKTKKLYQAKAVIQDKFQVAIKARTYELIADGPAPMGDDTGMTPMEMLLGALGSCKSIVFKVTAENLKMTYSKLEIVVEGEFDAAGYLGDPNIPIGFSAIRTIYNIETTAPEDEVQRLITYVESHCPVAATIAVAPEMSTILQYNLDANRT